PLARAIIVPLGPVGAAFGARFDVRVRTLYNMTELSTPIISGWDPEQPASSGRVRHGYHCRIVHEDDEEVEPGEIGELIVRSDDPWALYLGYWGKPEFTQDANRNDWFHTGDR